MDIANHQFPVCGFPTLTEPPYDEHDCASFEICPCCGTEFGNDDATQSHVDIRLAWFNRGAKWFSETTLPPPQWDPMKQLRDAGFI